MLDVRRYPVPGKTVKTIYCGVIPLTIATEVMIRRAQTAERGCDAVYYLRDFVESLQLAPDEDLSQITIDHIRSFADSLVAAGKSESVCLAYAMVIDAYFTEYRCRGGRVHDTLLRGDAVYTARYGRTKKDIGLATLAGEVIRSRIPRRRVYAEPRYTKWYTDEEISLIARHLSLRDRCIFLIGIETGYRISSILSIPYEISNLNSRIVEETKSKTGLLHAARISADLRDLIQRYINTDRISAAKKADPECKMLFLVSKGKGVGQALSYDAYRQNLIAAQHRINACYPEYRDMVLHTHAGRSTYLTRLVDRNEANKSQGLPCFPDEKIMYLMDWSTMACLKNYYDYRNGACMTSTLWEDLVIA